MPYTPEILSYQRRELIRAMMQKVEHPDTVNSYLRWIFDCEHTMQVWEEWAHAVRNMNIEHAGEIMRQLKNSLHK